MPLIENQYSDRSISGIKLKLGTITSDLISPSANISHSKLDISWSVPVNTVADLPTPASAGDSRVVLENKHIYIFNGTQWKQESGREAYPAWFWTPDDRIYSLKNAGINTSDPLDAFHIHNGSIRISNDTSYYRIYSSPTTLSIDDILYVGKSGKVGIKTNSPTKELSINGDISANSAYLNQINIGNTNFMFEENKLKFDGNMLIRSGADPVVLFAYNETTFYKDVIISSGAKLILDSDLIPVSTNNIGSSSAKWINGYINSIYTNEIKNGSQKIYFDQSKVKVSGILNISDRIETGMVTFTNSSEIISNNLDITLTIPTANSIYVKNTLESLITIDKDQVIINKNLIVKGSATYVESTNTTVADDEFVIKKGATLLDGNAAFVVSRLSGDTKLVWNDATDRWQAIYGHTASITSNLFTTKDLDSNVVFNANIGISVPVPTSRIEIQTSAVKEINFIGTSPAEINSVPSLIISSDNDIKFQTTNSVKISNLGDVGIGNTSPIYSLDIISNDDKIIRFKNTADTTERKLEVRSGNLYLTKDSAIELSIVGTNFGIGKNPIYDRLEVEGNIRLTNKITFTSTQNTIDFNSYYMGQMNGAEYLEITDDENISKLSVTNDRVGIGVRDPQYTLHVMGGADVVTSTNNQDFIVSDLNHGSVKNVIWYEYASSIVYLGNLNATTNSEVVIRGSEYIQENLGISKEPEDFKLRVYKESRFFSNVDVTTVSKNSAIVIDSGFDENIVQPGISWITTGDNSDKPKASIWTKTSSSGTRLFIGTSKINTYGVAGSTLTVHPDSRIGINNENPTEALDVSGNIKATIYKSGAAVGQSFDVIIVTDVRMNAGILQKKTKTMTYTGGIVTNITLETGWV